MGPEPEEGALTGWPHGGLRVASLEKGYTHAILEVNIHIFYRPDCHNAVKYAHILDAVLQ